MTFSYSIKKKRGGLRTHYFYLGEKGEKHIPLPSPTTDERDFPAGGNLKITGMNCDGVVGGSHVEEGGTLCSFIYREEGGTYNLLGVREKIDQRCTFP